MSLCLFTLLCHINTREVQVNWFVIFSSHLSGAQNKFAKFLLSCLKCCFWCLEKCIKFLNRNAYIMVSSRERPQLHGGCFCLVNFQLLFISSSRLQSMEKISAPQLAMHFSFSWGTLWGGIALNQDWPFYETASCLIRSPFLCNFFCRVAVLDKVTDFLLFLGKLLIVGIVGKIYLIFGWTQVIYPTNQRRDHLTSCFLWTGIFSFFFFSGKIKAVENAAPSLNYYWVPILVRSS